MRSVLPLASHGELRQYEEPFCAFSIFLGAIWSSFVKWHAIKPWTVFPVSKSSIVLGRWELMYTTCRETHAGPSQCLRFSVKLSFKIISLSSIQVSFNRSI